MRGEACDGVAGDMCEGGGGCERGGSAGSRSIFSILQKRSLSIDINNNSGDDRFWRIVGEWWLVGGLSGGDSGRGSMGEYSGGGVVGGLSIILRT